MAVSAPRAISAVAEFCILLVLYNLTNFGLGFGVMALLLVLVYRPRLDLGLYTFVLAFNTALILSIS